MLHWSSCKHTFCTPGKTPLQTDKVAATLHHSVWVALTRNFLLSITFQQITLLSQQWSSIHLWNAVRGSSAELVVKLTARGRSNSMSRFNWMTFNWDKWGLYNVYRISIIVSFGISRLKVAHLKHDAVIWIFEVIICWLQASLGAFLYVLFIWDWLLTCYLLMSIFGLLPSSWELLLFASMTSLVITEAVLGISLVGISQA